MQAILLFFCVSDGMAKVMNKLLGLLMMYMLTAFNFYSLKKYAASLQVATMFFKIAALTVISCTGIYYIATGRSNDIFANGMEGTRFSAGGIVLALYGGLFAYGGWDTLNSGVEDMRNPKRDLPIAIILGTIVVIVIYLLTNIGYFAVLGPQGVLKSDAVVVTFATEAFGSLTAGIVPGIVGLMASSVLNVALFQSSRTIFVAARRRHFPAFLSCLSVDSESPRPALALFALLATLMLMIGDLRSYIKYLSFVAWMQNVAAMSALIWIRFKKIPVHPGAIRMPMIFHFIFLGVAIFLVVLPAYKNPVMAAVGIGFVAFGIILYHVLVENSKLPGCFKKLNESSTILAQKFFFALPELYTAEQIQQEKLNQRKIFPSKINCFRQSVAPVQSIHRDKEKKIHKF